MSATSRARKLSSELGLAQARRRLAEVRLRHAREELDVAANDDTGYRSRWALGVDEAEHELAAAIARIDELVAQGATIDRAPDELAERRRRRDVDG